VGGGGESASRSERDSRWRALGLAQQIAIVGTAAGWVVVLLMLALAAGIAGARAARVG
jgi:hypothetical protein